MLQVLMHQILLKKDDLASLKSKLDKLDVDEPTPADLSKLKDVVKNKLLKRLYIIIWFKRLILFKLLILTI